MIVAKINETTDIVENTEIWGAKPKDTATHYYIDITGIYAGKGFEYRNGEFIPPPEE
jgi:hypothetical protein